MEVILLERIKHLGEMGALVSVKPGYARNYLIPLKKALRATEANKQAFLTKKAELEAQSAAKLEKAKTIHAVIDKRFVSIVRQAGEDGKLFGSVSPRDIVDSANKTLNQQLSHAEVHVNSPIKYVGVHEVTILLHSDLHATLYVSVARTESEAEELQKDFLAPPKKAKENE